MTSLVGVGCEITVLTGQPNYPEGQVFPSYRAASFGKEIHPEGYTIVRVPLIPRGKGGAFRLLLNYLSFVVTASLLGPFLLRGQRFDIVLVYAISPILQSLPAILIKLIKRIPLAIWVQDLWPQSLSVTGFIKNGLILNSVAAVTSWIYKRSDLLLVQSQAFIPEVQKMASSVPIVYHPNPGDLLDTATSGGDCAYSLGDGFNIVFAGNVGNAQSPETLLEVARCLRGRPHIRLVIVGGGSRLDWLAAQAEREGLLNLEFAGRFPSSAMPTIYAQASALLVILGSESVLTKTIPSKIPSYMAAAKPIIGSIDGEGARVLCEAGAGLVVPAADAQQLVAAILTMSEADEAALSQWGQAGQRYFNEYFHPGKLAEELKSKLEEASIQYER